MSLSPEQPDVSVIVPARNEEANLANCLRSLVGQSGPSYEIIVVDDHSSDRTGEMAKSFPVRVITADPLPEGWSGKCNACWSGAKVAKGKWLLFTDADTRHGADSIAQGLREAKRTAQHMLSYSPEAGSAQLRRARAHARDLWGTGDHVSAEGSERPEFAGGGRQRTVSAYPARCL